MTRLTLVKQLTCPACGVVLGEATYRRWPGDLTVRSLDGRVVQPEGVATQIRREESALAAAEPGPRRMEAEARIAFLRRNLAELVLDLRCRNGHSTLRTVPQVARGMRRARGAWLDLAQA